MLTEDQRALMIATIMLHGFDLYERFHKDRGLWSPILIGPVQKVYPNGPIHWCVATKVNLEEIADKQGLASMANLQPLYWFKLTDKQLIDFHKTVVTTS